MKKVAILLSLIIINNYVIGQDYDGPKIEYFTFTPDTIDITSKNDTVNVSIRVTDATGVKSIPSGGNQLRLGSHHAATVTGFTLSRTSGDAKDGIYTGQVIVAAGKLPGEWNFYVGSFTDSLNNTSVWPVYPTTDKKTVTVLNSNPPEQDGPKIEYFTFTPDTVYNLSVDAIVGISIRVTDATGVKSIPSGGNQIRLSSNHAATVTGFTLSRTSGDAKDGIYTGQVIVAAGKQPGEWNFYVGSFTDSLNNTSVWPVYPTTDKKTVTVIGSDPPYSIALLTTNATSITKSSAYLNGYVTSYSGNHELFFQYGKDSNVAENEKNVGVSISTVISSFNTGVTVENLASLTNYSFRLISKSSSGEVQGYGNTLTFATPSNTSPVISIVNDITVNEDASGTATLGATDADGDALTYSAVSDTNGVTVSVSSATLTLTPIANWNGVANIKAYASDGSAKDSTSFKLTVTAVNDAPVISAVPDDSTNEETEKTIVVSASDVEGDALTYTASSDTSAVGLTVSSDTLKLTPTTNYTGIAKITVVVSDNALKDTTSFNFKVININDAPVIAAVSDVTIKEDSTGTATLSATDIDGDALTYSAVSDTNAVTISVSSSTLTLTPNSNWHGVANIKAYASDSTSMDSTSFKLTVTPVNDMAAVDDVTIDEDKSAEVALTSTFGDSITFTAVSDTNAVTVSVSSTTLTLTPNANWHGVANIKAYASDGSSKDSTSFKLTVNPVQDVPTAFEWVSGALDTINITQDNLETEYIVDWTASTDDADGDSINYLLYAQIGVNPPEEIYDTTSTSVPITYEEFLENVFEPFPMLPRVTVKFSVVATDGIDTVNVTGDDRVLFVNRYEFLSTEGEGVPVEFALHENYPNPFNPTTTLRFDLPEVSDVTLTIYNMLGQKVRTFNMNDTPAGFHSVTWNATNDYGDPVGAGMYLYQLRANQFVKTKKMVLLK